LKRPPITSWADLAGRLPYLNQRRRPHRSRRREAVRRRLRPPCAGSEAGGGNAGRIGKADYRRFYTAGAGEQHFGLVQQAIRKALETKHPPRDHVDDEPARPPRKPAGPRKIYTIGGFADAIDDRESIDDGAEADA
jgi:hypothetical protein